MAAIDVITAILAIPGVEEDGQVRDARPGEKVLDKHFARLGEAFESLCARDGDRPSALDELLGEFLGTAVTVEKAEFSWYEKKGVVYPAVVLFTDRLHGPDGHDLAATVTERFRRDDARQVLAGLLGRRLGVDWVSVYATFGPSR